MNTIPAISVECKRVFSNTKLLITDIQAQMRDGIIEPQSLG